MSGFFALTAVVAVGAITPGPNNLMVLQAARVSGWRAAARCVAGVIVGSLGLLAVSALAAATLERASPLLAPTAGLAGAAYLAWLGVVLIGKRSRQSARGEPASPRSFAAAAAFQLVNPKAWLLSSTVAGSVAAQNYPGPWAAVGLMMVAVSAACLGLWAAGGAALDRVLDDPTAQRAVDKVMGLLLLMSAAALALNDAEALRRLIG